MLARARGSALLFVASIGLAGCAPDTAKDGGAAALHLERTLALADVEGRIDHLALDPSGKRLAVAALGNGSVEVLDLATGTRVKRIAPLEEPQGVAYLPDGRLVVACGGDGTLRTYATDSLEPAERLDLGADADNVRVEAGTTRLFVGHGRGAIAGVEKGRRVLDLALAGHPESFQLETTGTRLFVNVPSAGHVAVLDRATSKAVTTWPIGDASANYPMALDETRGRLFVGCRTPARLLVLDTRDGRRVASVEIAGDVDDVWVDRVTDRVFVSCGGGADGGAIDVLAPSDDGTWRRVARTATPAGARTCLFDAGTRKLYLAVPHRGPQAAEVRVYAVAR